MLSLELPKDARDEKEEIHQLVLHENEVLLVGPSLEIRFPVPWARKLLPWLQGPARNIVCTANPERFNLLGITKEGGRLLLTYIGPDGKPRVKRMPPEAVQFLDQHLQK